MSTTKNAGPRSIAVVGPYLSGKTSLLESILFATGAITRKGTVKDGNTVGDSSPESRDRQMGTELNVATTTYLDDSFTFLDCPGSVEFAFDAAAALVGADAAVVVCEPEPAKAVMLMPIFKALADLGIPHFIFVNKVDRMSSTMADVVDALQSVADKPLVLRHLPILDGETSTGYVDLASRRAYAYLPGDASKRIDLPSSMADEVAAARFTMLEKLADFSDSLMEHLLEDIDPEQDEAYDSLSAITRAGNVVPVLIGSADRDHGVRRLLKALRHEVPGAAAAAGRAGIAALDGEALVQILKTYHTQHGGKVSVARVWRGTVNDGMTLGGERVSGLFAMLGHQTTKVASASPGMVVGLGRLEKAKTGDPLSSGKEVPALRKASSPQPVYALAVRAEERSDEVKLSGAMARLLDEDPSLSFVHDDDTNEWLMRGQGEIHLRVAVDRMKNRAGLSIEAARPHVPYKEAIRRRTTQHARYKKQTGGHGQFGDIHIEVKPLPRGSGFRFDEQVVGGAVPRQFIPAVEAGVQEYLHRGPLGFPVVDVSVTLTDRQYHSVDSSEMAFKTAGRMAMAEAMPKCDPVLLEPVIHVEVIVPSEFTSRVNGVITGRRGQILGFDARREWPGWDVL
jgi:elongation factor G